MDTYKQIKGYRMTEEKVRAEITDRTYNIYKYYIENFKEKPPYNPHTYCRIKQTASVIAHIVTYRLVDLRYYCPRCCTRIDKFTFAYHPVFTMGCNNCRVKKTDSEKLLNSLSGGLVGG